MRPEQTVAFNPRAVVFAQQPEFTVQTLQHFTNLRYGCTMGDKDKAHNVQRAMNMLWDFVWYDQIFKQSTRNIAQFRTEYRDVFEGFLSYLWDLGYSAGSMKTFRCRLLQFEAFLLNNRITHRPLCRNHPCYDDNSTRIGGKSKSLL